jgi:hypothetical protein
MGEVAVKQDEVVKFEPQPGPQRRLFALPLQVNDILYGGARGGGKSHGILIHFYNEIQQEYGKHVRGIIFRRTYPELEDIIGKAKSLFQHVAVWNDSKKTMTFDSNGAILRFRFLEKDKDADRYQGHEYTWICIEEAGNFPNPVPIDKLRACLRSAKALPKFFLMTANPGGPGHNWLKSQYVDPAPPEVPHKMTKEITLDGEKITLEWYRIFIPAKVTDNRILMQNDPACITNIVQSAGGQEWLLKAWLHGDWNIVAGGMFDDVWDASKHVLPSFRVPENWRVYRSFDWGSSKPFSVGWWAISDGGYVRIGEDYRTFKAGTLIRIGEWYGWNGTVNTGLRLLESEFVEQLLENEEIVKGKYGVRRVHAGPADSAIFTSQDGQSIADKHEQMGVAWEMANKGPGSRIHAWQEIRGLLNNSKTYPMEDRGMFVTEDCLQFIRLIPSQQRDPKNLDDIDTKGEDHLPDEVGYMARWETYSMDVVTLAGI